jgi:transposase
MIPSGTRIFVCTQPVDMRRSFAGLVRCTQEVLQQDPAGGALFIFAGRRGDSIKALWWDKSGYCILYKRLSRGVFHLPAAIGGASSVLIDALELALILEGIEMPSRRQKSEDNRNASARTGLAHDRDCH